MTQTVRHTAIPFVGGDQTIPLLWEGYGYLSRRMRALASPGFESRLFGRRAVFIGGREAAEQFYDNAKFQRHGAVPGLIRLTLFGKHTVQALDGTAHRHRKAMFQPLADPDRVAALVALVGDEWQRAAADWASGRRVRLFDETVRVLGIAACRWAGVPTSDMDLPRRLGDMAAMVDHFGSVGIGQLWGRLARLRSNYWAARHIAAVRDGQYDVAADSVLSIIAHHRDLDGRLLDLRTASEELLNVLRPIVAVAWWLCFSAHALHTHPLWPQRLAESDDNVMRAFTDEVRRWYPFAPLLAARVRREFRWSGHRFEPGRWVILDVYGTNHDPMRWNEPDAFDPQRFIGQRRDPFDFIPQGGGDVWEGHRCPGEDITNAILARLVGDLATWDYRVPDQDLTVNQHRFPAKIRSGFVIADVMPDLPEPSRTDAERADSAFESR